VVPADEVVITGYKLYMDNGFNGNFKLIYDRDKYPSVLTYVASNLTTGLPYRFNVNSLNINGISVDSPIATIYSCLVPSNVNPPYKISTTSSSLTVGWNEPKANACPIIGFSIYRDNAANDAITNEVDSASVRNKPSLR
jgi:hypothetical protein